MPRRSVRARRLRRWRLRVYGLGVLVAGGVSRSLPAQSGPATSPSTRPAVQPAARTLDRVVSIPMTNIPLAEALLLVRRRYDVPLAWSGEVLPAEWRVTVGAEPMSIERVLTSMLAGTGLRLIVTRQGSAVVVRSAASPDRDSAAVMTAALPVDVARSLRSTGVQQLDQVIVMGSSVDGGPERELPTTVRVVSDTRLQELSPMRLADVIRTELPGLVQWDRGPTGPPAPFAAVRGVASFTTRAIKTYVDGVELASPELFTLLDARGIEQIEMIRGPQGAALYGPDALNGIVQIRTRHGRPGGEVWQPRLHAAVGRYERPDLHGVAPIQELSAGVGASTRRVALDLSASFVNAGRDSATRQMTTWTVQAGVRALAGPVMIEASARAAEYEYAASRLASTATTTSIPQRLIERAVSVTATQQLTERWRHSLVAGRHAISGDREPFRSPLLPPRLPSGASFEQADRLSVRYGSTIDLHPQLEVSGGAEFSTRASDRERVRSTLMTDLTTLYANELRAVGGFTQARLRLGSQLVVSGGTRAERLSSVGPRQGTVWASTAGASWSRAVGRHTVRLRGAWGRGIRPPEPGMQSARATSVVRQIANPDLAPERQQGFEGGFDLFAPHGIFFKATWYAQVATDLLQQVSRRSTSSPDVYQFQNVGVIDNRGVEVDAGWRTRRLAGGVSVYVPRSTVRSLSPRYTGELRPGDRMIEVPEASGSAYLRLASPTRWTAELGTSMLGAWTGYDWLLLARIERGQATRRDLVRDYWLRYDGVVRPYVSASVHVARGYHAWLRVDNPTNTSALIRDNATAPLGRVALLGLELRAR